MSAKKNIALILLPLIFLLQCSTWYQLTKKESKYYTPLEINILTDTTNAVDFRFGFDPDMKLDYIYMAGNFSQSELAAREKKMRDALSKYTKEEAVLFYEKIFRLTEIQTWKMNNYKKEEDWPEAALIEKYLLPDTVKFLEMLEKNVILIDANYRTIIEERKRIIREQVINELS